VGGIYRHPNCDIAEFTQTFETTLSKLAEQKYPCIIAGDINIDLAKNGVHSETTEYVNTILVNNFIPTIIMPSRVTNKSATIIDHIYFYEGDSKMNVGQREIQSGNIWCDLSDHLPNYMILTSKFLKRYENDRPFIRIYSSNNRKKFHDNLSTVNWLELYKQDDANAAYTRFNEILTALYDKNFPLTRLSRKRAKDKKWITSGLKVSSRHKNKLYIKNGW
jgi:hypothetical protein